jgi:hypothetical protein
MAIAFSRIDLEEAAACRSHFCNVAPAATRSALLLPLATGAEQKLERGPRRSLAWPVVYVLEVDRLGRRFHALMTGSAAAGLGIQPPDRRLTYRRCRAHAVVGRWAKRLGGHGPPRGDLSRRLSSCSSTPRSGINR